jgi:hypothetical protein
MSGYEASALEAMDSASTIDSVTLVFCINIVY